MQIRFNELVSLTGEIWGLTQAIHISAWDQMTYMPLAGHSGRSRLIAVLSALEHQRWADPDLGRLLIDLAPWVRTKPHESFEAGLVRFSGYRHNLAKKVPVRLKAEMAHALAEGHVGWQEARKRNDFNLAKPYLDRNVDLGRRFAACFSDYEHPGDALMAIGDPGITVKSLKPLFSRLRRGLLILLGKIRPFSVPDDSCLRQDFSEESELDFGRDVASRLGYDFLRGRLDLAVHPFASPFDPDDVRITTRIFGNDLMESFTGIVHEAGHAMYEQGIGRELVGTPLAQGASETVHESQSRLWENIVARHPAFWEFFYPKLKEHFPNQFDSITKDQVVRAVNRVIPSPIRANADEVTYNLHAIMRFEFETGLLDGTIKTADLPHLWKQRLLNDLGLFIENDAQGVLQDPHWFDSGLMSFQSYVLGNMFSVQFYNAALQAHPEIPALMVRGDFSLLRGWLAKNIYIHGAKFTPHELLKRAVGEKPKVEPLLAYLSKKYKRLYRI